MKKIKKAKLIKQKKSIEDFIPKERIFTIAEIKTVIKKIPKDCLASMVSHPISTMTGLRFMKFQKRTRVNQLKEEIYWTIDCGDFLIAIDKVRK